MDGDRFQHLQSLLSRALKMSEFYGSNIRRVMDASLADQASALHAAMQACAPLTQEPVLGSYASSSTAVDGFKQHRTSSTKVAVPGSQPIDVVQVTATMVRPVECF